MKGCGALNWISSIFLLFTFDYHMRQWDYTQFVKESALKKDHVSLSRK